MFAADLARRSPLALTIMALVSASPEPARSQGSLDGFSLVRDLEMAAGHAPFTGWVHQAPQGLVTLSLGSLWRIAEPGNLPTQLLDEVSRHTIRGTRNGPLVVVGTNPVTREAGTWLIDGSSVAQHLAPEDLWLFNWWDGRNLAEHGGIVLVKNPSWDPEFDGLWKLAPGQDPIRLGPSGGVPFGDDPTIAPWCGGVFATSRGFLHCRYESASAGVYLSNGTQEKRVPGVEVLDLLTAHRFGPYLFVTAAVATAGWEIRLVVLRSDGTAEGTTIFDTRGPRGAFFELDGRLGWLTEESGGGWAVLTTDGESSPTTLATGNQALSSSPYGVADGKLYLYRYLQPGCAVLAVDGGNGAVHELDTGGKCPTGSVVDADDLGGPVAFIRDGSNDLLWSMGVGTVGPLTAPALPWRARAGLSPLDGDPLIPLSTAGEIPRMARASGGTLEPWDGLSLSGTGGSFSRIVGEIEGEAIIAATTEATGATLWRSRGTAGTTRPLEPALATHCSRWWRSVPVQIGPTAILDCVDPASGPATTVWIFDSLDKRRTIEIELANAWGPPAVGALPEHVVFGAWDGLRSQPLGGGPPALLVPDCQDLSVARVGDRVLAFCSSSPFQTRAWSTDGTVAGTQALLDVDGGIASVTKIGPKLLVRAHDDAWTTDGTLAGTVSIGQIGGALETSAEATWTCLWDVDQTISRFEIATGQRTVLARPAGYIYPLAAEGVSTVLPFVAVHSSSTAVLWRCDGTSAGTVALSGASAWWRSGSASAAIVGDSLWVSGQRTPLTEQLDEVSLRTGQVTTHLDRVLPINDDARVQTDERAPLRIKLASGFLWTTLTDPAHGREPWAMRIAFFADGFESGDTSAWSNAGSAALHHLAPSLPPTVP